MLKWKMGILVGFVLVVGLSCSCREKEIRDKDLCIPDCRSCGDCVNYQTNKCLEWDGQYTEKDLNEWMERNVNLR